MRFGLLKQQLLYEFGLVSYSGLRLCAPMDALELPRLASGCGFPSSDIHLTFASGPELSGGFGFRARFISGCGLVCFGGSPL